MHGQPHIKSSKILHYRKNVDYRKLVQLLMQHVTLVLRISVELSLSFSFL